MYFENYRMSASNTFTLERALAFIGANITVKAVVHRIGNEIQKDGKSYFYVIIVDETGKLNMYYTL